MGLKAFLLLPVFVIGLFFSLTPFQAHAALIGHWTFDADDINWDTGTVTDTSGNGNNGTVHGLTAADETTGQVGGALQFHGTDTNSYVSIPVNGSFPVSGNHARTVCMWFKPTDTSWTPSQAIFGYGQAGDSFGIDMDNFPNIQFYTWHNDLLVAMGIAEHEDDWLQICWVWDGTSSSLVYSNGVLRGSTDFGSSINTPQTTVNIGQSTLGDGFFPGVIDDVRMYDTALTGGQIDSLHDDATNPAAISNVASTTGETTATVTWDTTATSSDSTVWYGTSSGAYTMSTSSAALVTSHSLGLAGLSSLTTYYFVAVSSDGAGDIATSSEETLTTTADLTPPSISITPLGESTDVPVDSSIVLTFSEPIDISTADVSIAPCGTGCATFDETWSAGNTVLTLTNIRIDGNPLANDTRYIVHIASAKDLAGNDIVNEMISAFTTVALPATHGSSKSGGSIQSQVANLTAMGNTVDADALKAAWPTLFPAGTNAAGSTTASAGLAVRDLETGMTGEDVLALQRLLNANGSVLASSGAGAPGSETMLFGALTRTALSKYQAAHGIVPAIGYFGPITRAQMKDAGIGGIWW